MKRDQAHDDRETNAEPTTLASDLLRTLHEPLEDVRQERGAHACTAIDHGDLDLVTDGQAGP